jgi:penicillin-binding protein A
VIDRVAERRRRLIHRVLPALGALAGLALAAGIVVGTLAESAAERVVRDFARAWERADYGAMYDLLTPAARARYGRRTLEGAYRRAAATATATRLSTGQPEDESGNDVRLTVTVSTRAFGAIYGKLSVPVEDGRVEWAPRLVFPGLEEGGALTRRSELPERAALLARNGQPIAEGSGEARSSSLGEVAASIAGRLEPEETAAERGAFYARGFPRRWPVGQTGLERAFEPELAGRPGGELLAGRKVLASALPLPGHSVRTTIDLRLQEAAVAALGGRLGGIAVLDARTAAIRALAGIAFSAPQPPGSTFKLVTTTAALEAGLVEPSTVFPVQTRAVIDGVELENAQGEACGGTFRDSFAHSCNSVFAPLGVRVGAGRLVAAAERYGFNAPPAVRGEMPSTLPPAAEIRTPLEVGSTAIGQGKVLATPLRLASIAQAVAAHGVRTEPTLRSGRRPRPRRVTTRRVAATLTDLMVGVVGYGTGVAASIPGVKVAGKTGTAELEDTRGPKALGVEGETDPSNTDAWFAAFAPADRPQVAVAALFVRAGAGGATAAPAVRSVLAAALGRGGL